MKKTMNKRTVLAATTLVWAAGLGSAAALAHVLAGPAVPAEVKLEVVAPTELVQSASESDVVDSRTLTVVASRPSPRIAEPKHRDISEMYCQPWRELDMGSGRVQICD